jgi:hypothetical protein
MSTLKLSQLLDGILAVEQEAVAFYRGLEKRFDQQADVACFWRSRAYEELQHIRWFRMACSRLTPAQMAQPAPTSVYALRLPARPFCAQQALAQVRTLEDACRLAVALEESEIGDLLDYILDTAGSDGTTQSYLRQQVERHIERVALGLPPSYKTRQSREALLAATLA